MKIFRDPDVLGALPAPVVAIGNFDGVHLGHQKIIEKVTQRARTLQGTSILMTFDPHPLTILRPAGRPPLIVPMSEKIKLLSMLGLEILLIVPFTREFANLLAEKFVEEILGTKLKAKEVYVGANFHFGRGGVGDLELLRSEGAKFGIQVERVPVVLYDSQPISSTRIRENIERGSVERATAMLGREYAIRGLVVHGRGRGAGLGFSTANLSTDNELIPAQGVYVTRVEAEGGSHPSVTNIGDRPTFGERERVIETHLLDYAGPELYGRTMRLSFCMRLREERRFESPAALSAQIKKDVAATRAWFKSHS
ncbi:MAG TPA: bifunctional riboflavin kinase/FAD synthetase [Patescibacteria group bacterium]|jgi:riboflavin kinase/FMN adenylyltransferase|nr:bifunctional riboflavin kinase/FAD synthetase [Patescibacteria group bacterium]